MFCRYDKFDQRTGIYDISGQRSLSSLIHLCSQIQLASPSFVHFLPALVNLPDKRRGEIYSLRVCLFIQPSRRDRYSSLSLG